MSLRDWLEKLGHWMVRTGDRLEKESQWPPADVREPDPDERPK